MAFEGEARKAIRGLCGDGRGTHRRLMNKLGSSTVA